MNITWESGTYEPELLALQSSFIELSSHIMQPGRQDFDILFSDFTISANKVYKDQRFGDLVKITAGSLAKSNCINPLTYCKKMLNYEVPTQIVNSGLGIFTTRMCEQIMCCQIPNVADFYFGVLHNFLSRANVLHSNELRERKVLKRKIESCLNANQVYLAGEYYNLLNH